MDDRARNREETGQPIWIRYSTQFTTGGRTHTVEISVPLPAGATPELRERLFREAEAGLSHLVSHVESRIPSLLQQARTSPSASSPAPASAAKLRAEQALPREREALAPAPQQQTQLASVSQVHEPAPDLVASQQPAAPRSTSGINMPSMPGAGNGNISLPEFIQAIKELGLTPRQAMDRLKVKSLSTGLNLREALDHLEDMIALDEGNVPPHVEAETQASSPQAEHMHNMVHPPAIEDHREEEELDFDESPAPVFDEEIEPGEEEDFSEAEADDEEEYALALTAEERHKARTIIDSLREMRGATQVNNSRLKALNNVIGDQITQAQLLNLIRGVWGVQALSKLKVDQVEELIHWAKQDDFVSEVEAVLTLLEEE